MELSPFFYGLYKTAKYAVYPYSWLIVLLGLVMVLTWLPASPGITRWLRRFSVSAFSLAFVVGSPIVAFNSMGALESWHPPRSPADLPKSDVIVVLGGGVAAEGKLRPRTEPSQLTKERVLCGVDLFQRGLAPTILLSGGDATVIGVGPLEAEAMKQFAMRLGVPEQAIVTETRSRTTQENAAEVRRLIQPNTSVLLVTSAYHMPRSQYLFDREGIRSSPYPCGYYSRNGPSLETLLNPYSWIPTSGAFLQNSLAISEVVGMMVASLSGSRS
jgi:uncharacterized SAM-binding protein YcdF (DUF218 family)